MSSFSRISNVDSCSGGGALFQDVMADAGTKELRIWDVKCLAN